MRADGFRERAEAHRRLPPRTPSRALLLAFCIERGSDDRAAYGPAYESPFIAAWESAQIRLKEASLLSTPMGGHGPFRGLDAPLRARPSIAPRAGHVSCRDDEHPAETPAAPTANSAHSSARLRRHPR